MNDFKFHTMTSIPNILLCYILSILFLTTATSAIEITSTDPQQIVRRLCPDFGFETKWQPTNNLLPSTDDLTPCRCIIFDTFALHIECQDSALTNSNFEAEQLPAFTERIDLSWNHFEFVPELVGEDLRTLDISNNVITAIADNNFEQCPTLMELNLNHNRIETISINSFTGLSQLISLDLSRNLLRRITVNVFSPLVGLKILNLSRNRFLNDTFSRTEDSNLFLSLGVTPNLHTLTIEESDLTAIDLMAGVHLKELNFKFNEFKQFPDVPRGIRVLDFSGNPIDRLTAKCLPHLNELEALWLTDMPNLTTVQEYALFGLAKLRLANFEGSWNLNYFDDEAFGVDEVDEINTNINGTAATATLTRLILRGTDFRTINESMAFAALEELDLAGTPIVCDCAVKWILESKLETNAECMMPMAVRGKKLSSLSVDDLKCKRFAEWVYRTLNGLLVLLLLVMCGVAIWLIVTGLRPKRGHGRTANNQVLQKIGAASPYARVTIEPNRAEDDTVVLR